MVRGLKARSTAEDAENRRLREDRDRYATELSALGQENKVMQTQLRKFKDDVCVLTQQLERKRSDRSKLEQQVVRIHGEAEMLRRENANVKFELAEVKGKMKDLQADLDLVDRRHSKVPPR
ncbi:hypothetical protein L218DRAFT_1006371 [Marasmius fiardii PR-910]|nr:hypothetical protein L218DRAFT_1006371 [Marasmius fiardii PR-910]